MYSKNHFYMPPTTTFKESKPVYDQQYRSSLRSNTHKKLKTKASNLSKTKTVRSYGSSTKRKSSKLKTSDKIQKSHKPRRAVSAQPQRRRQNRGNTTGAAMSSFKRTSSKVLKNKYQIDTATNRVNHIRSYRAPYAAAGTKQRSTKSQSSTKNYNSKRMTSKRVQSRTNQVASIKKNDKHQNDGIESIQDKHTANDINDPIAMNGTCTYQSILAPLTDLLSKFKGYEQQLSQATKPNKQSKSKAKSNCQQSDCNNYDIMNNLSPLSTILSKYNGTATTVPVATQHRHSQKRTKPQSAITQTRKKPMRTQTAKKVARPRFSTYKKTHVKTSMTSTHNNKTRLRTQKNTTYRQSRTHREYNYKYRNNKNNNNNSHKKNTVRSKSDPWNVSSLSLNDLRVKSLLGEGAFSKVYLIKFKQSKNVTQYIDSRLWSQNLALKVIENKKSNVHVASTAATTTTKGDKTMEWERFALSRLNHPFLVQYYGSFVDRSKLCILTEFVIGGEILYHFENSDNGRFDNRTTQFYIAEIMCALEYLHRKRYVYRDLKPENILLDSQGHIKLVDFGFAKKIDKNQRTHTLCGSKEYVAPEVLTGNGHSFAADYWSLGVLTYEFAVGCLPFPTQECDPFQVLGILEKTKVEYPSYVDRHCIDFIKKLLVFSPSQRLGCQSGESNEETNFVCLKNHIWFESNRFNWQLCNARKLKPPIMPKYKSSDDASNFATARFDLDSNPNDGLIHF